jgi:hypothetical protein
MVMKVSKKDPMIRHIVETCYPEYKGRKFRISTNYPTHLRSYWDEGSRTWYCFYQLSTGKHYDVEENHPYFGADKPYKLAGGILPKGIVIVAHSIFCGKDSGITIYANEDDLIKYLPEGGKTIEKLN